MHLFIFGIIILFVGYRVYGPIVERILGPDDRPTPAISKADNIDFVVLPQWKNALIQLLNIAGIGPVIGVILGIKFGSIVFLVIPIGCVLMGATHDFVAGMMSIRSGGANLPILVRENIGKTATLFFSGLVAILLILVVTVFINIPASLTNGLLTAPTKSATQSVEEDSQAVSDGNSTASETNAFLKWTESTLNRLGFHRTADQISFFWVMVAVIFSYYILATLFPVDAIIGRFYPFFGLVLLIGTAAVFFSILLVGNADPHILNETPHFQEAVSKMPPLIPCLFVNIACGILSGFHATQSPIIARTMGSEREAKADFFGMMILEGVIAMIWAAGALAIYNYFPAYLNKGGTDTLVRITDLFLGRGLGTVTVLSVIILAITSGDTALRCLRLTIQELLHLSQKSILNRLLTVLPLLVVIVFLLFWSNQNPKSFNELWNYFAWGNQVLAATTLMTATVWLMSLKKNFWITFLPGIFMTFVVLTFILWTSKPNGPIGFGLPIKTAYLISGVLTLVIATCVYRLGLYRQKTRALPSSEEKVGGMLVK